MKYVFTILLTIVFYGTLSAQLLQGTLKPGTTPNSVIVAVRPTGTFSGTISGINLTIQIPSAGIVPAPMLSIRNNLLSTNIPSYITNTTTESGFINYLFVSNPTGTPAFNFTNNVEVNLLELEFTNGPSGVTSQVRLASLPGGGSLTQLFFYIEVNGADRTNVASMFYGASASNDAAGYTAYSFVAINGIVLPLKWNSFTAQRQANDAILKWDVSSEEETEKYVVERSLDGVNFTELGDVQKTAGMGNKQYSFPDRNITSLGTKIVYYRIKNVDIIRRYSFSAVKSIRLDVKGDIGLFPNPAKEGFTLTIPYLNPDQQRVQLQLVNSLGQVIERKDITRLAATNYYYNVQSSLILSGEYLLKIYEDGELSETKRVIIKK